jgi:hypothetical protein
MNGPRHVMRMGLVLLLCSSCSGLAVPIQQLRQEEIVLEPHPKFSADTVIFFVQLEEGHNPTVSAAVRLHQVGNSQHRTALANIGAIVQSMVGEIVTIQAPALSLYTIADLDFVVSVEIATPMQLID